MVPFLSCLPFLHKNCKKEIQRLIQCGLNDNRTIQELNIEIVTLINQVQELKAINDYQAADFEHKIVKLEAEIASHKSKPKREYRNHWNKKPVTTPKPGNNNGSNN